ncbi:MAG TPA: bifunctional DNA-formamidopyrimidine glycosylase/DNA-(apurinic or apyrimidinic site) lyase [Smithella sp.]|nr:bifunctional DNA-formamidopyrimidine glycosylase/DNA-(apurinic or apyrimidinic site) lyase [Smithella sp.]
MPELPEVETLSRQLHQKICGRKILSSTVYDDKLVHIKNVRGRRVIAVERDGKMIDICLDDGNSISVHLRMTGRFLWQENAAKPKHGRWRMGFDTGNLFLIDPRRFATVTKLKKVKSDPGKDILKKFDFKGFVKNYGSRKTKVKSLIMDQRVLSGIGNIYACEILFKAGIHPERAAATLTEGDWKKLFHHAKELLKAAIQKRGTSISDWRDLSGCRGENQYELKVYGQEGNICCLCGKVIARIKQGGRSTFYCPCCQK